MGNNFSAMKKRVINDIFAPSPELMKLRTTMFRLLVGFWALRAAFSVYEIVFVVMRGASLSGVIPNLCGLLLMVLFAYAIYNGASTMSFLAAFGGVYTLITNFANQRVIDYITTAADLPYNIYMFVLGVLALIQIVLFVYVGLAKRFKPYFEACMKVNNILSKR